MNNKRKVFLGGTCNNSTWRGDLMPLLDMHDIDYFNPVVENWTKDCIAREEDQKWNHCDTHLYMLTKEMTGVYSLIEFIDSIAQNYEDISAILIVNTDGMPESMVKSLRASTDKILSWRDNGHIGDMVSFHIYYAEDQDDAFDTLLNSILLTKKLKIL